MVAIESTTTDVELLLFKEASSLPDLSIYASTIELSYHQYASKSRDIADSLALVLTSIANQDTAVTEDKKTLLQIWKFRKLLNIYISTIIHYGDTTRVWVESATGIPTILSELSFYLGQIKDAFEHGLGLENPEVQYWAQQTQRLVTAGIDVSIPAMSVEAAKQRQIELAAAIVNMTQNNVYKAPDFHRLRKIIRDFMHCCSVLIEDRFKNEAAKIGLPMPVIPPHFKRTRQLLLYWSKALGEQHDRAVQQAMLACKADPSITFFQAYSDIDITLDINRCKRIQAFFSSQVK